MITARPVVRRCWPLLLLAGCVGWSEREPAVAFLQHPVMMMMSFPNLVIIDRAGVIRHQIPGGDDFFNNEEENLKALLAPLLKAPAPAAKKAAKKAS